MLNLLLFFCAIIIPGSCTKKNFSQQSSYQFRSANNIPDYSNLNYWAAHPWKQDPSDSLPDILQQNYKPDSLADVFFIHPTTLTDYTDQRWNATIDDADINAKTDYSAILYQASAFNEKCRVFAPRYRQAHIRSFFTSDPETEKAFEIAYQDVKTAFEYYLKNYNNNKPIIIASHSQGTKHAGRLLKEFFENKPLQKQLVCAYIVGMPVPDDYFTILKPCTDSLATGCFVSWRTFKNNSADLDFVAAEKFTSIVVNPLTWTQSTDFVPASFNTGAVLKNFSKIVPHAVSAQIHNNILWSSKPNVPGKIFYTQKNYHVGDINLFYMNIRENVTARVNSFIKNNR
ncbi:MAG: DUF3089 domain-containing protein [Chitinophagaceae bacterium]|nr:DUF3089 domain-containing protein [Chitinophagaceae bacterium]